MPTNKEALIRYRVINRTLRDFTYVTRDKLIRVCEEALDKSPISKRTILQDLHDMREDDRLGYHAPIKFDTYKQSYFYEDPDYSIDNIPLNDEEVRALTFTATMLEQFRHVGIFGTFSGAVQKILEVLNVQRLSDDQSLFPFIEFEQSPDAPGSGYVEPLLLAIRNKQVVKFRYQRYDADTSRSHTVHPYLLKQYRNRWYLIGWLEGLEKVMTYGLDRITELPKVLDKPYHDIGFDTRAYYRSVVGITAPQAKPVKVVLKFTLTQAWYVISQPIHPSQTVAMKKDHALITLNVIPTYELIMMIMSWGADVEVVKPANLRDEIRERHLEAAGNK
jgi:predicted DNA-binding transcriptional regulator YafY